MDSRMAARDLKRYRRKGPDRTSKILLDALTSIGVEGLSLLDIGGGVGVLQHELLKAGASGVISVDASSAYLEAARQEAEGQGHLDRIRQHHGDFVQIADGMPEADIVTLDRVICCYDDMEGLVGRSASLASSLYGVVYQRYRWWVIALTWLENLYLRMRRSQFRAFAHATSAVDELIRRSGLERCFSRETSLWQIHVYRRSESGDTSASHLLV